MPTRRTSPRRTATRPSGQYERTDERYLDEPEDGSTGGSLFASAAPWLALLAVVLAAAALAFVVVGRGSGGGDLSACRSAAWKAIPDPEGLPASWNLGSTDLNANGLTISFIGAAVDEGTAGPVVYASVTCYGDAAATALEDNRRAAEAAGSVITDRTDDGLAYDVDNPSTGSVTTLFRVGGLVGQVADAGSANQSDLAVITTLVARAMGDESAAGTSALASTDDSNASEPPVVAASDEPLPSAFAPELEALLPTSIGDAGSTASPGVIPLTIQSASATDVFGDDPSSRALAARIRALGSSLDQLQIAQAFDESGSIDLSIVAFRLPKADQAKLRAAVIETWLSAGADGVTKSSVTLSGKSLTKIDYGDGSTIEYVYGKDDVVIVIDTSDVQVATQVAAKLN
ncbi:MAG: hypothetical protein H0V73_00265 [Chloroflexi bacterium]|nr:hypothetical protein [Chloroflexota bacterium]